MTDIAGLSLSQIRSGLDTKTFTAVELTSACLASAEKQVDLNCFALLDPEYSLEQARAADEKISAGKKGALLGVPVAIKDVLLTKGLRSTAGSRILHNFIPPYSATAVSRLLDAGAIVLGKTNMDEFAMGSSNENSCFGPVKNPWDKSRVPGGSSGGSAAAVAARIAPLALGSDTGGSIRQPAALCGICGMKPTYGRVSRYGVIAFASSLDQVGGFAANVSDLALLQTAISGHDPRDSTSVEMLVPDFSAALGRDIKGLRIGIPREYFIAGLNPEVEEKVRAAVKLLTDQGASTVEISLPHTEAAVAAYYIIAPAEASSNLARYDGVRYGYRAKEHTDLNDMYSRSRSEGFGPEVRRRIMIGTYVLSTGYYDAYYLRAQKVRTLIAADFKKVFEEQCDIIACPTTPDTAFKLGELVDDPLAMYLNDVFTIPVNLAGLPGMSLPCGFDKKGLPVGLQLIGRPWDEESLFRAAYAYEQCSDWHTRKPGV